MTDDYQLLKNAWEKQVEKSLRKQADETANWSLIEKVDREIQVLNAQISLRVQELEKQEKDKGKKNEVLSLCKVRKEAKADDKGRFAVDKKCFDALNKSPFYNPGTDYGVNRGYIYNSYWITSKVKNEVEGFLFDPTISSLSLQKENYRELLEKMLENIRLFSKDCNQVIPIPIEKPKTGQVFENLSKRITDLFSLSYFQPSIFPAHQHALIYGPRGSGKNQLSNLIAYDCNERMNKLKSLKTGSKEKERLIQFQTFDVFALRSVMKSKGIDHARSMLRNSLKCMKYDLKTIMRENNSDPTFGLFVMDRADSIFLTDQEISIEDYFISSNSSNGFIDGPKSGGGKNLRKGGDGKEFSVSEITSIFTGINWKEFPNIHVLWSARYVWKLPSQIVNLSGSKDHNLFVDLPVASVRNWYVQSLMIRQVSTNLVQMFTSLNQSSIFLDIYQDLESDDNKKESFAEKEKKDLTAIEKLQEGFKNLKDEKDAIKKQKSAENLIQTYLREKNVKEPIADKLVGYFSSAKEYGFSGLKQVMRYVLNKLIIKDESKIDAFLKNVQSIYGELKNPSSDQFIFEKNITTIYNEYKQNGRSVNGLIRSFQNNPEMKGYMETFLKAMQPSISYIVSSSGMSMKGYCKLQTQFNLSNQKLDTFMIVTGRKNGNLDSSDDLSLTGVSDYGFTFGDMDRFMRGLFDKNGKLQLMEGLNQKKAYVVGSQEFASQGCKRSALNPDEGKIDPTEIDSCVHPLDLDFNSYLTGLPVIALKKRFGSHRLNMDVVKSYVADFEKTIPQRIDYPIFVLYVTTGSPLFPAQKLSSNDISLRCRYSPALTPSLSLPSQPSSSSQNWFQTIFAPTTTLGGIVNKNTPYHQVFFS